MGINIGPSSSVGYKQSINFLGDSKAATETAAPAKASKPQGDTVVIFGKEVGKKQAIAGGIIGAAALTGIVAAAIYLIRGGAIGSAVRNAKKMTNEATQLAETVKKNIDDVSTIYEKASAGGVDGVTIKTGKNGVKIMTDIVDGKTRKTVIESGLPSKITTYLKGGKKDIITINQGKQTSLFMSEFAKGKNGVEKWAKELESTLSGTPTQFSKNVAKTQDGVYTAAKRLTLSNGEAATYGKKFQQDANGVISYAKGFLTFKNGQPASYVTKFEKLADGTINEGPKKVFDGKKWTKAKKA